MIVPTPHCSPCNAGFFAIRSQQLQHAIDQLMEPSHLTFNDVRAVERCVRGAFAHPRAQHLEIDDYGIQRILDLVRQVVGQAAHELEAIRSNLVLSEPGCSCCVLCRHTIRPFRAQF